MPPSREAWAAAFAAQSRSDWQVYNLLSDDTRVPGCHELHYLQMACEKIAKAYRSRDPRANLEEICTKHVGFANFIGSLLASPSFRVAYRGREAQLRELSRRASVLAREIEKLAPAVDRIASPENAEYPWQSGEDVMTPCKYSFPRLSLLTTAGGRHFLKLVARAIEEFESAAI